MAHLTEHRAPDPPTVRRWIIYAAWLLCSSALLLLLIELGCRRLGFAPMGTLEQHPCPGAAEGTCTEGTWSKGPPWLPAGGEFRLNARGDRAPQRLPAGCRVPILFLGDSFTFGQYLSQEDTFPQVIARSLAAAPELCVYNGGRVGATLSLERERFQALREELGSTPRIVVHQFFADDVYQEAGAMDALIKAFFRERFNLVGIGLASTRLQMALAWHFDWAAAALERRRFAGNLPEADYRGMMDDYSAAWGQWMDEVGEARMERVELVIPFPSAMASLRTAHLEPLLNAAAIRGIPILVLTRENLPKDPYLYNDLHFDAAANRKVAELLLPYIWSAIGRVQGHQMEERNL